MEAFLVAYDETKKKIEKDEKICNKKAFLKRLKELRKDIFAMHSDFKEYYDDDMEWLERLSQWMNRSTWSAWLKIYNLTSKKRMNTSLLFFFLNTSLSLYQLPDEF